VEKAFSVIDPIDFSNNKDNWWILYLW